MFDIDMENFFKSIVLFLISEMGVVFSSYVNVDMKYKCNIIIYRYFIIKKGEIFLI